MAQGSSHAKLTADLIALLQRIPRGQVLTVPAVSRALNTPERLVTTLLGSLQARRSNVPWHRVVMEGGALGRHADRDTHLGRLRTDGVAVAPAGIVQDMARVAIRDAELLPKSPAKFADGPAAETSPAPATPPSRSRGRLGAPKSTV